MYAVTVIASSPTATYGSAIPAITAGYVNLPPGQAHPPTPATCTTAATSSSPAGTYPTICSGAAGTNETFSYVAGSVTINPAPVVVTASSTSVGLGDPIPPITASYAGLKNGDLAPATLPTCGTPATSSSPLGLYPTTCSGAADPNYTFSYTDGTLGIGTAVVTVTASSGSSTYGDPVPPVTASYSGFHNGQTQPGTLPTCSTSASDSSPAGSYATSCSGAADANYTFVYVAGTDTIAPAPATITASSVTFSFGFPVPAVTPTYSGLTNGDTAAATPPICSTTATSSSSAGNYPTTCSGASDPNYTFNYVNGVATITPGAAPVTVTASSATITYGAAIPAITPSYSGFTGGQTTPATAPTCTTTATASSPAGTYPTTCSGAADPNFTFATVGGTVTIQKAQVMVTASSDNVTYGGTVHAVTPSYSGLVHGDIAPATAPTCSTTATSTSNVGAYPSSCSGAADPSYDFTYVNGSVNVTPADATVKASSGSLTYGGTVPAITASYTGLVNGDTHPATLATCSTTATPASPAGTYPSTCAGAGDANYTFSYTDGTVTVNRKAATITASSLTITYGSSVPAITPVYSGLVNGDTAAATAPTCSTTATNTSSPSSYPTSCSGAADPGYTFGYVGGTLTINKAPVTVTASSATINQGDAPPAITASYSGFLNGQTLPATRPTCSTTATSSSPAGTYPSVCSGAADPNYTFTAVNGTVTVTAGLPTGYAAYSTNLSYTTNTTAPVTTNTSANNPIGIPVADSPPYDGYQNLTIQSAIGPISVFCKGPGGLALGSCYSPSTHVAIPSGSLVTSATFVTFDVYSIIPGGKAVVKPTSLTVVTDVPVADRAQPTYVAANASFGLLKFVPSPTVTGKFQLTFGYCTTATTYSAADPSCHTGVVKYGATISATFGSEIPVNNVNQDLYQNVGTYAEGPVLVPHGSSFTEYLALGSAAVPHLQLVPTLGEVTVNSAKLFGGIIPIPAGTTYVSSSLMGGDSLSGGAATTITYCTNFTVGNCALADTSSHYSNTTTPFLVVFSNIAVTGGGTTTIPTVALTLAATGAPGSVANTYSSEYRVSTSVTLSTGNVVALNFKGWPSDPSQPAGTPPTFPPRNLVSTLIF